jgi:hypothetical protein
MGCQPSLNFYFLFLIIIIILTWDEGILEKKFIMIELQ